MPMPHLKKIGNRYYMQRRVPQDLLGEYPCKMIKRALKTSDLQEAKSKLLQALAELEREFTAKRKALTGTYDEIGQEEAQRLAAVWLNDVLGDDWGWRTGSPSQDSREMMELGTDETLTRMREALGTSDQSPVQADIRSVIQRHHLSVKPGSQSWRVLGQALLEANVRAMELVQDRINGNVVDLPTPSPATPSKTQGITLGELLDRYMADPSRHRSDKTADGYKVIFGVLRDLIGAETAVRTIRPSDCQRVRDLLLRLPPNASKRFKGLSLTEAADRADTLGLKRLSPTTVNSYLHNLSSIFGWAVRSWECDRNPAEGLRVADPRRSKDKRDAFSPDQLHRIFNAPLYTGCKDDGTGYAKPGPNKPRRGRFWVPLLSLFSGMRLNECCQLHTGDVREQDGVWCIIISEDSEPGSDEGDRKRVKTDAGERYVPIHPELTRLGFLSYVTAIHNAGHARLFPELKPGAGGYYSDPFSKWYSRFLEKAGSKTSKNSFHSFRHTFRDAMREADLSSDYVNALGGWSGGKTSDNYGSGLKPATLAKAIAKLNYPGLDLSHLRDVVN